MTRRIVHPLPRECASDWLYVWQCVDCGWLKIGLSCQPWRRAKENAWAHRRGRPYDTRCGCRQYRLLLVVRNGTLATETELQQLFCDLPGEVRGEWYAASIGRYRAILCMRDDPDTSPLQPVVRR